MPSHKSPAVGQERLRPSVVTDYIAGQKLVGSSRPHDAAPCGPGAVSKWVTV